MNQSLFADATLEVSDFVALVNQTFDYAYPSVTIRGELANFRVSKNRWVYFDLKDETATVRFFGTVYQLQGPLEDGMVLKVRGTPRLHPLYGFSVTVTSLQPEGEGTIRRAAQLLQDKLTREGLFDPARKRPLPYPPRRIGLIASKESAAYVDFLKIINARWRGLAIDCVDVQVQGEAAPSQIVAAIEYCNQLPELPDVLVVTRGGGSPEDLYAFSTEQVTRAVAGSRIPTLVAIGHERDLSLAELAADVRASTPSNAAELLVPDIREVERLLRSSRDQLHDLVRVQVRLQRQLLRQSRQDLHHHVQRIVQSAQGRLVADRQLLRALNPQVVMARGYAIVRHDGQLVRSRHDVADGAIVTIEVADGRITAAVKEDH